MSDDLIYSRPLATAARLAEFADDAVHLLKKRVLLTGESEILSTWNGRECFLNSLRLLVRFCRFVNVDISNASVALVQETMSTIKTLGVEESVSVHHSQPDFSKFDAILSIGSRTRPDLPWTVINSNGWILRVSSGAKSLSPECSQANPIGALAAACMGATDVFKRLIQLKSSRGLLVDGLTFSLFSYRLDDPDAGPQLPNTLAGDVLLVGAGAIGNGLLHLLSQLPMCGWVFIVDEQDFGKENFGTCLRVSKGQEGPKALFAETLLRDAGISAKGFKERIQDFAHRIGMEFAYPSFVINGLDNIPARHAVQDLWPDLVIDGAIGDFEIQVSRHPWGKNIACLKCFFQEPAGESAASIASKATGLTLESVLRGDDVLTEEDVQTARPDKRQWLEERIGGKIKCTIIPEAVLAQISESEQPAGFQPSIPFTACLSACMVMGELVKAMAGWTSSLAPAYQMDVLRGPQTAMTIESNRNRSCLCELRKKNIETIRNKMRALPQEG